MFDFTDPPGRWISSYPQRTWSGMPEWTTPHGNSIVHWRFGVPVYVENAITLSGRVLNLNSISPDGKIWADRHSTGTLDIANDRCTFISLLSEFSAVPGTFASDLCNSSVFRELISDDSFLISLYSKLENSHFYNVIDSRKEWFSQQRSLDLLSSIRGGDVSFCRSGKVSLEHYNAVGKIIKSYGWVLFDPNDCAVEHYFAIKIAESVSSRRPGVIPLEDRPKVLFFLPKPTRDQDSLLFMMNASAMDGKVTIKEYRDFVSKFDKYDRRLYSDPSIVRKRIAAMILKS